MRMRQAASCPRGRLAWTVVAMLCAMLPVVPTAAQSNDPAKYSEEILEWLESAKEAAAIESNLREFADIRAALERARSDPSQLTGDNYAELFVRLTLMIPDAAEVPDSIKHVIKAGAKTVGLLIGAATNSALDSVRVEFDRRMKALLGDTSMTEVQKVWEAAKVGGTEQVRQRLFLDWMEKGWSPFRRYDGYPWNGKWYDGFGNSFTFVYDPESKVLEGTFWGVTSTALHDYQIYEGHRRFGGTVRQASFDLTFDLYWKEEYVRICDGLAPHFGSKVTELSFKEEPNTQTITMMVSTKKIDRACKVTEDGPTLMIFNRPTPRVFAPGKTGTYHGFHDLPRIPPEAPAWVEVSRLGATRDRAPVPGARDSRSGGPRSQSRG